MNHGNPQGEPINRFSRVDSPIGSLLITADATAITGLYMDVSSQKRPLLGEGWTEDSGHGPLHSAVRQLAEYFAGTRRDFDLPLRMRGTAFQRRVWSELKEIPYGKTWNYGQLARRIENPNAYRAVGLANGRNPIAIIVPCHRVIGADGSLTGFGGGLDRKQWLLAHEGLH
jgi:methylated-DNA-[protein]-cysteine S-methyltransferase